MRVQFGDYHGQNHLSRQTDSQGIAAIVLAKLQFEATNSRQESERRAALPVYFQAVQPWD